VKVAQFPRLFNETGPAPPTVYCIFPPDAL
jgi:hypothetical protein